MVNRYGDIRASGAFEKVLPEIRLFTAATQHADRPAAAELTAAELTAAELTERDASRTSNLWPISLLGRIITNRPHI